MPRISPVFLALAAILTACASEPREADESPEVTRENFATAETHRYFQEFTDQGAVNTFVHEKEQAVALDQQTVIRSNIDMFYSHAIVDISEGATVTLPPSSGRFRLAQIIDSNHYTTDVFYDEGTYELKSNSGADFVYVFMRTAADPTDPEDQDRAREVMEGASITSIGGGTFHSDWDPDQVVEMRREIIQSATYTDSFGAFGDVDDIEDFDKFTFAAAAGWGGLPEAHAAYWPIEPALGDACATMTIEEPPVDRYWSLTVYDEEGWLANVNPVRSSYNTEPNEDGSLTFNFGCGDEALNNLPITENWTFILRMYGPREAILDGTYKAVIPHLKD
ncbi:MAG: DUF1254 domain-containing protein [Gemmatimonadota bacterium]